MRPRAVRLMRWILKYKGSCIDPIGFNTLFRESRPGCEDRTNEVLSGVNAKLEKVDRLQEFEINDRVKLLYMLSHPVNEVFEIMLRDDGSTLELTDHRLIAYFRSADGTVERGVAPVKDEPMGNENIPDESGALNLVEPKQEIVEQSAQPETAEPVEEEMVVRPVVKMEAVEPVAQNVEVAQHHVEPIREVVQLQSSQNDQGEVAEPAVPSLQNIYNIIYKNINGAQEVPTPNLAEPNREPATAPTPQEAPAEQTPANGSLGPKREVPSSKNDQEEVAGPDVLNRVSHQNPVLVPAQEVLTPNQAEPNREPATAPTPQEGPAEQTPAHSSKQEVPSFQNDQEAVSGPDVSIPAQKVSPPNLIEPNREAVNAPNPQEVHAVEHTGTGTSACRNKKNKKRNRKRKNVESQTTEGEPVVAKVLRIAQLEIGMQVEPIEATAVLENLSNLSLAFEWSDEFALKAQDEIRKGRSGQKILKSKIQKVVDNTFEVLTEGASSKIPVSEDSIKFVHFLRVYRTWLLTTKYNSVQDIDNKMGEEIRAYDNRENEAEVKRIRIDKLLLVFGMWFNVATPPV
ncbi:unnamed protein product [Caenorhabditis brenneri]